MPRPMAPSSCDLAVMGWVTGDGVVLLVGDGVGSFSDFFRK